MTGWFRWLHGEFEHALNLATVSQWAYKPGPGAGEHALVWKMGESEPLRLPGEEARDFREAMLAWMRAPRRSDPEAELTATVQRVSKEYHDLGAFFREAHGAAKKNGSRKRGRR